MDPGAMRKSELPRISPTGATGVDTAIGILARVCSSGIRRPGFGLPPGPLDDSVQQERKERVPSDSHQRLDRHREDRLLATRTEAPQRDRARRTIGRIAA